MSKSKDKSEVEYLRSENKALKKQLKHMKRDLSRSQKRSLRQQDFTDDDEALAEEYIKSEIQELESIKDSNSCPNCSHKIEPIKLPQNRTLLICSNCDYRKTIKGK